MNFASGKLPSPSSHNFAEVPRANIQRSRFDRSHSHKTTFDEGWLVPILVDEALPGDTFSCDMSAFGRLNTPIFPIMDNLHFDVFFFAVPYRLVWDNWEKFNGAQDNPADSTDFLVPVVDTTSFTTISELSLSDYLGIPVDAGNIEFTTLWHRAYSLIWNEWFRDENLQDSITVPTGDGPDDLNDFNIKHRNKRHDYFTSCLPWPQKGPTVDIPLGTSAPIEKNSGVYPTVTGATEGNVGTMQVNGANNMNVSGNPTVTQSATLELDLSHYADLSSATAATINQLRQSFQIQKLYERDARGGTRYTEIVLSHFNVSSPDQRLQRPEYLGGTSTHVNISPTVNTSATATEPQGTLAGVGTISAKTGFHKSFTEHCLILGLVNVRADLTYQQGLDRMFSRSTRFDFYWPSLAHIGEQAVLNKEIYAQGTSADDDVFGYQERFAEYRYKNSRLSGLMRSNLVSGTSLDAWHLAQDFGSLPVLNSSFITSTVPIDRVVAVPSEPDFILDTYFNMKCARPMPVFSVPGLIDHF
jgi:hypothetical protein